MAAPDRPARPPVPSSLPLARRVAARHPDHRPHGRVPPPHHGVRGHASWRHGAVRLAHLTVEHQPIAALPAAQVRGGRPDISRLHGSGRVGRPHSVARHQHRGTRHLPDGRRLPRLLRGTWAGTHSPVLCLCCGDISRRQHRHRVADRGGDGGVHCAHRRPQPQRPADPRPPRGTQGRRGRPSSRPCLPSRRGRGRRISHAPRAADPPAADRRHRRRRPRRVRARFRALTARPPRPRPPSTRPRAAQVGRSAGRRRAHAGLSGATAQVGSAPHPGPLGQPSARYLLRRTFGRDPVRLPVLVGLRCACAGLAAGTLALVLHVGHAYWAVLSATIVLHGGLDRNSTVLRAAHRLAGTVAGVLVVSAVEPLQPPAAVHISIIIVSVWGMNLFLPRNYALAASFITVMTLQANIAITSVDATPHLVGQRLLATLIGVAAAVVVLVCTGRCMPRRTAQRQLIRTLRATTEVLDHAAAGTSFTEDGWKARRDLCFELLACADLLPRLGADDRRLRQCQDLADGVQQQAHAALAAGWHAEPDQLNTTTRSEEIRSLLDRLPGQRTSAHTPTRGRRIRGNVR
ncbi:FUSC family protein [Streptomyces sp. NPDC087437]|uniref:FUSC family protein n=1 Tax=Streptomyces sp. NPDC087437 TaxID=3365789 RepID=UPI00381A0C7D